MATPLVKLDPDGTAQGTPGMLNHNVPDAISYPGKHYIAFDFPSQTFQTLLSDTCYFDFPAVEPPIREEDDGGVDFNKEDNASYVRAAFEILQAMQNGFQSSKSSALLESVAPGTPGAAIMQVRGPFDRWFPDLHDEARSLRFAVSMTDPMRKINKDLPCNIETNIAGYPALLPQVPFALKAPDGADVPYTGVYSIKDDPAGCTAGLSDALCSLTPYRVLDEALRKRRLVIYRDGDDFLTCKFVPFSTIKQGKLYLVEEYRLSSFYGNYGAGRTIKTMSLLPGEKTKVSLKTYRRTTETTKESSCMLDSFSNQIAEDLQSAVESESTNKENSSRHDEGYVEAEIAGNWGSGTAKVSGGFKGGSSSAREQMGKNVSKALQKHSSTASAKRDVKVEQSSEMTTESGEQTDIEREIQNVNVGNTLNFVFRQMNQDHVSLLHLTDIKVAFSNGTYGSFRAVPLHQIEELIRDYMRLPDAYVNPADLTLVWDEPSPPPPEYTKKKIDLVRDLILNEAANVVDWKGVVTQAVEKVSFGWSAATTALWGGTTPGTATQYVTDVNNLVKKWTGEVAPGPIAAPPALASDISLYRFKRQTSSYQLGPSALKVPGIIVAVSRNVMRTDGVIVDALLGIGDALDVYSHGLQAEAMRAKTNAADAADAQTALENLKQSVVTNKDAQSANVYTKMFPLPQS